MDLYAVPFIPLSVRSCVYLRLLIPDIPGFALDFERDIRFGQKYVLPCRPDPHGDPFDLEATAEALANMRWAFDNGMGASFRPVPVPVMVSSTDQGRPSGTMRLSEWFAERRIKFSFGGGRTRADTTHEPVPVDEIDALMQHIWTYSEMHCSAMMLHCYPRNDEWKPYPVLGRPVAPQGLTAPWSF
jgi:hypothetical protein